MDWRECARRYLRRRKIKSFGRKIEQYASPQDRRCRRCPVGELRARRLELEAESQADAAVAKLEKRVQQVVEVAKKARKAVRTLKRRTKSKSKRRSSRRR